MIPLQQTSDSHISLDLNEVSFGSGAESFDRNLSQKLTAKALQRKDTIIQRKDTIILNLRKQLKQQAREKLANPAHLNLQNAVFVTSIMPPLKKSTNSVIMSTEGIAGENQQKIERMRGNNPVKENSKRELHKQPYSHQMSSVCVNKVGLLINGTNVPRNGDSGGSCKDLQSLMTKAFIFFTNFVSIKTLVSDSGMALAIAANDEALVQFSPRKHFQSRRKVKVEKPLNVTGFMCRKTLTHGLHACMLAFDKSIVRKNIITQALVVSVSVDGSSFGPYDMLGIVLDMTFRKKGQLDAIGNPTDEIYNLSMCLNSIPVGDKMSIDIFRDDGSQFEKSVPCNVVTQFIMSGCLGDFMGLTESEETCVYFVLDKGSECRGGGKGQQGQISRNAFNGRGSILNQICGTREAITAVKNGKHFRFLQELTAFLEVSADWLQYADTRPLPDTLNTAQPVMSLPFKLHVLTRKFEQVSQTYENSECFIESVPSRLSTHFNPMALFPMQRGGGPTGSHCNKHGISLAAVESLYMNGYFIRRAMKASRELRKIKIYLALKHHYDRVVGIKGAKPEQWHLDLRERIDPKLLDRQHHHGLTRQSLGCQTRWITIQKALSELHDCRLLLSGLMPMALGIGEKKARIDAASEIISVGFTEKNLFMFPKKIGFAFYCLTAPHMILQLAITNFMYIMVWQPLLAGSCHHKECASSYLRGIGSIFHGINFVLGRGIFVDASESMNRFCYNILERKSLKFRNWIADSNRQDILKKPNQKKRDKQKTNSWDTKFVLGHRGTAVFNNNGQTLLSKRLENVPEGFKEPPQLVNIYGPYYTERMGSSVTELLQTMTSTCNMNGDILSKENGEIYKKKQDSFCDKMWAAQWLVKYEADRVLKSVMRKVGNSLVTCPLGFLGGIYDMEACTLKYGPFNYDTEVTEPGKDIFYVATDNALANAALLETQIKEIVQLYGPELPEFCSEPLRGLIKKGLPDLEAFNKREQVKIGEQDSYVSNRHSGFPKPVTAFSKLCTQSLMAGGRPTSTLSVERKWSLVTCRYKSYVRHCSAEYMSLILRQKDFESMNMLDELVSENFQDLLSQALEFRRLKQIDYKEIYQVDHAESHDKLNSKTGPKLHYTKTNIQDRDCKKKSNLQEKVERKKTSKRKRASGAKATRNGKECKSGSESEESSESLDASDASDSNSESNSVAELDCAPRLSRAQQQNFPHGHLQSTDQEFLVDVISESTRPASQAQERPHAEDEDSDLDIPLQDLPPKPFIETSKKIQKNYSEYTDEDASDVSEGFCESDADADADDDAPLIGGTQAKCKFFQKTPKLTDETAKSVSPWKFAYISFLLLNKQWKETKVECITSKNTALMLTRLDDMQFPLMKTEHVFYVANDDDLALIYVEDLKFKVLDVDTDQSKYLQGTLPEKQWCVEYSRVFLTEQAVELCESGEDYTAELSGGQHRVTSLGRRSLTTLLDQQKKTKLEGLVCHKGDLLFEMAAKLIVGFVAWESVPTVLSNADENKERAAVLKIINKNLFENRKAKLEQKITMKDLDWVFCGADFSECDGSKK